MKIMIDMSHPAHVHLFKNFIWMMQQRGHNIKITARDKDVTKHLLDAYRIPYTLIGKMNSQRRGLIREWILRDLQFYIEARRFNPDCLMGVLNPVVAHSSVLIRRPCIIFTDSEPEAIKFPLADAITLPFADTILSPTSVRHDYGKKGIRVNSYKELAYLHPNNFSPNEDKIRRIGLIPNDYVILRFINWRAYHDHGRNGFSLGEKRRLVECLKRYAHIFISSESPLPQDLERYNLPVPPEDLHHFLYFAKMLVCDSQTMATEAAVLGIPTIRYNSFVGGTDMGNFLELENKYKLIYNFSEAEKALKMAVKLVQIPNLKNKLKTRKDQCLRDKIDLTEYLIWFVENIINGADYPCCGV